MRVPAGVVAHLSLATNVPQPARDMGKPSKRKAVTDAAPKGKPSQKAVKMEPGLGSEPLKKDMAASALFRDWMPLSCKLLSFMQERDKFNLVVLVDACLLAKVLKARGEPRDQSFLHSCRFQDQGATAIAGAMLIVALPDARIVL